MILDSWSNMDKYEAYVPGINNAMNVIHDLKHFEVGRYELEQGFYMIQKGETVPSNEGLFEAHEKYIDVQIMISGEEILEWARTKELTLVKPYHDEKDIEFYSGQGAAIEIKTGMSYILFPTDGHKPCCHKNNKTSYTKIVIKLPIKQNEEI